MERGTLSDFEYFGCIFRRKKLVGALVKIVQFLVKKFFQEKFSETLRKRDVSCCASPAVSLWAGSKSVDGYIMGGPSCEQCMLKSSFESLVQFRCEMG